MLISPCDCDELFTLSEEIDDAVDNLKDEVRKIRSDLRRVLYILEASAILRPAREGAKPPADEGES